MRDIKWKRRLHVDKRKLVGPVEVRYGHQESGVPPEEHHLGIKQGAASRVVRKAGRSSHRAKLLSTDPLTVEEISEGTLTEDMIRVAAGTRQLLHLTRLALVIDSSKTSVEGVWAAVPNLSTLVLDRSKLLSFRDLGVGLRNLNTLSLESSRVEHLDGIGALSGLRELRLAHNRVSDVTPLACHGNLQVVGFQRNRISDMKALEILGTLPLLYSLDLSQNPLMESLGKLLDGQGRGVVHQLIPQIKILDGINLSEESSAIDVETLTEADKLIHQGAFSARAAWAEEDAAAEQAADQRHERETEGPHLPWPDSLRRRRSKEKAFPVMTEGKVLSLSDESGIVHWDSALTQGGGQAFSGNPSSAIRRHKLGKDVNKQKTTRSPTRILETLDTAKMMEEGLKQRHTHLDDRVSQWRIETFSDSLPVGDSFVAPEGLSTPSRDPLPLSSRKRLPPEDIVYGCSASLVRLKQQERTQINAGCELSTAGNCSCESGDKSYASPTPVTSSPISATYRDSARKILLSDRDVSIDRPWTTGGFGGRSLPVTATILTLDDLSPRGAVNIDRMAHDMMGGVGGKAVRVHSRSRRPQTATELGSDCNFEENLGEKNSWQPVWESLQPARLVSSEVNTGTGDKTAGKSALGGFDRIGSVDFRRQRRARTTRKKVGGMGEKHRCIEESDSTSAEEGGSSEQSEEVGDRNQIKKRASDFEFNEATSGYTLHRLTCFTPPPYAPSLPRASIRNKDSQVAQRALPRSQTLAAEGKLIRKTRRRGAASMASRRSLAAMDDSSSSSEDESCPHHKSKPVGHKSASGTSDVDGSYGRSIDNGSGNTLCDSSIGTDVGGSSIRRASSIHASRMLGFDLRKSLAAIDEWTGKAPMTVKDGSSCGVSNQMLKESGRKIPFLVEHSKDATPYSNNSENFSGKMGRGVLREKSACFEGGSTSEKLKAKDSTEVMTSFTSSAYHTGIGDSDDDDGSEEEAVLSVAEARAALGISKKTAAATATILDRSSSADVRLSKAGHISSAARAGSCTRRPLLADIDTSAAFDRNPAAAPLAYKKGDKDEGWGANRNKNATTPALSRSSGRAVGMSDEALERMLRRQPRTVPELRTKDSFREFFQGMEAERMGRLLRGAYEGTLPADELDKKVQKRLGLVGDKLEW